MEIKELKSYRAIAMQIITFEQDLLGAPVVDTTREAVNSGKVSKPTEDTAMRLMFSDELQSLRRRKQAIERYIIGIKDIEVREMVMRRFMCGEKVEQVAEHFHCDRKTVTRKIARYLSENK